MLVVVLARFIGLATGTAVCLALWVLLVSCRRPEPGRPVAIALITVAGAWYVVQALDLSMQAVAGNALGAVAAVVTAAAILTPSLLLAFALAITGRRRALLPVLALAPMAATLLLADWTAIYAILLSLSAGWSAWLLWKSTVPGRKPLALSFAIFALTALSGPTSVAVIYGALAPLCCLLWLMGRHNLLGVVVTRRSLLVAQLGVASAAYLIFVRRVTDAMERNFDVFGPAAVLLVCLRGWDGPADWQVGRKIGFSVAAALGFGNHPGTASGFGLGPGYPLRIYRLSSKLRRPL